MTANEIATKWIAKLGLGFHPDTPGADYEPALSPVKIEDYEADMRRLFTISEDPYAVCIESAKNAGVWPCAS